MSHNSNLTPRQREITELAASIVDLNRRLLAAGAAATDDDERLELLDIVSRIERKMMTNQK
jgi:hypothetical protein